MHYAAGRGHQQVVRGLLDAGAITEDTDMWGLTPMHSASTGGQAVCCLLEAGADMNTETPEHDEPDHAGFVELHYAAGEGHLHVVRYLLEVGADMEAGKDSGLTPVHWAAAKGQLQVVHLLLEAGLDKDTCIGTHQCIVLTPLHVAAGRGNAEVVICLLGASADVDKSNTDGDTPWHVAACAACYEDPQIERCLVAAGADRTRANVRGCTPVHLLGLVVRKLSISCCSGNNGDAPIVHLADLAGYGQVVSCLLGSSPESDKRDKEGDASSHLAVYKLR